MLNGKFYALPDSSMIDDEASPVQREGPQRVRTFSPLHFRCRVDPGDYGQSLAGTPGSLPQPSSAE